MNVFATHNSGLPGGRPRLLDLTRRAAIGCALALAASLPAATPLPQPTPARLLEHAQNAYLQAQQRFHTEPTNHVAAWEFARATFERAEFATNDTERAALAVQGIDAARKLIARDPRSAPGHYYLGKNLGQFARTKLLSALKIVDEMEQAFKAAAALDERLDHAGPHRYLGSLYFEAPVIGSVGSRARARKHFERALELAPDYPENRLNLAEAYAKWREKKHLQRELEALRQLWPTARAQLNGPDWAAAWVNWSRRWEKLQADVE